MTDGVTFPESVPICVQQVMNCIQTKHHEISDQPL